MTGNARKFGIIGRQHAHIGMFIEEMLALGYECAGVYEPDNMPLARTLADRYGLELTGDQGSALSDEGVSVIRRAAINHEKMDVIEQCESHGKPVMIDKPAVTDRAGLTRRAAFWSGKNRGRDDADRALPPFTAYHSSDDPGGRVRGHRPHLDA